METGTFEPSDPSSPVGPCALSSHRPCGKQDGAGLSPDGVCPDGLQLHSGSEPQEEPGPGEASADSRAQEQVGDGGGRTGPVSAAGVHWGPPFSESGGAR